MPDKPHDRLFKAVFSVREHAIAHFRDFLPEPLGRCLDLDSLEPCPEILIGANLSERQADVVYRAALRTGSGDAFLPVEHQSTVDPLMPLRALRSDVLLWDRWLRDHPGARRLPPVIPCLLYHGEAPWSAPPVLVEMLDVKPAEAGTLSRYTPQFEPVLWDVWRLPATAFGRGALAGLPLLLLKHVRGGSLVDRLPEWAPRFAAAARCSPLGWSALEPLVHYVMETDERADPRTIGAALAPALGRRAEEVAMTVLEKAREEGLELGFRRGRQEGRVEGRAEGHVEGRAEGHVEGRAEGARALLLRQIALRFGGVPAAVADRIERAGLSSLERWAERVLTARDAEDVVAS